MSNKKETFLSTLVFVFIVCLVCAALVSISAISLKPTQNANKLLDQQTKILEAAGLLEQANGDINGTFAKYIEPKFIELSTGDFVEGDLATYDERSDARDVEKSSLVKDHEVGLQRRADVGLIFLVKNEAGHVDSVVFPIVGMGLWDLMYGFIGLEADLNTVKSVVYSQLKETPGLGAEVLNPKWKALWHGKQMFDENHHIAIQIVKGGADKNDINGVDALSGATLTSRGVNNTIHFWLGDEGFGPFIAKYRDGGLN